MFLLTLPQTARVMLKQLRRIEIGACAVSGLRTRDAGSEWEKGQCQTWTGSEETPSFSPLFRPTTIAWRIADRAMFGYHGRMVGIIAYSSNSKMNVSVCSEKKNIRNRCQHGPHVASITPFWRSILHIHDFKSLLALKVQ